MLFSPAETQDILPNWAACTELNGLLLSELNNIDAISDDLEDMNQNVEWLFKTINHFSV